MEKMYEWEWSQVRVECNRCHMFAWGSETIEGSDGKRYHPDHLTEQENKLAGVSQPVTQN